MGHDLDLIQRVHTRVAQPAGIDQHQVGTSACQEKPHGLQRFNHDRLQRHLQRGIQLGRQLTDEIPPVGNHDHRQGWCLDMRQQGRHAQGFAPATGCPPPQVAAVKRLAGWRRRSPRRRSWSRSVMCEPSPRRLPTRRRSAWRRSISTGIPESSAGTSVADKRQRMLRSRSASANGRTRTSCDLLNACSSSLMHAPASIRKMTGIPPTSPAPSNDLLCDHGSGRQSAMIRLGCGLPLGKSAASSMTTAR